MTALRSARTPIANVCIPLFVTYEPHRACKWSLYKNGEEIEFRKTHTPVKRKTDPEECWTTYRVLEMRDEFLQIQIPEEALAFLNKCGEFDGRDTVPWSRFMSWWQLMTDVAVGVKRGKRPFLREYIHEELKYLRPVSNWHIGEDPDSATGISARTYCYLAIQAIDTLIQVERATGGTFFQCKNCGKFFAKGDTRREGFCSHKCGHRFTQRDRRQKQRQTKSASKPEPAG